MLGTGMKSHHLGPFLVLALTLSLLSSTRPAWTENAGNLFRQGNAAYNQGDFDGAILFYEKITRESGFSAAVLYNLANSYAEKGRIGLAILNYERARRLKPGDPDILGNLEHLRKKHGLFNPEPSFFERVIGVLEPDHWTGLAFFAFVMLTISLAVSYSVKKRPGVFRRIGAGSLILLLASTAGTFACFHSRYTAIITKTGGIEIGISPFKGADSVGKIQEGRGVKVGTIHDSFIHIVDETKRSGWVPLTSLSAIEPQDLPGE